MAKYIASYDLRETSPSPHAEFLEQAKAKGWRLWILSGKNERYRLPNTTLDGDFADREAAVAALKATRTATEAKLGRPVVMEKWIVAERNGASFDSDVHQPAS